MSGAANETDISEALVEDSQPSTQVETFNAVESKRDEFSNTTDRP